MDSPQSTYLYLLPVPDTGPRASGATQASAPLPAGDHTIEVIRKTPRRADGAFTVTVATDIEAPAAVTVTALAARYDATVHEASSFIFNFEPSTASSSQSPPAPTTRAVCELTARSCAGAAATTRVSWTRPAASSSRCLRTGLGRPDGGALHVCVIPRLALMSARDGHGSQRQPQRPSGRSGPAGRRRMAGGRVYGRSLRQRCRSNR